MARCGECAARAAFSLDFDAMRAFRLRPLGVCLALPWLAACGADDDFKPTPPFSNLDDVRVWANASSALGVYSNVYQVLAVADGHETFANAQLSLIHI